ncbi:hypothetical protein ScPMuIL_010243 [Solemya velum]
MPMLTRTGTIVRKNRRRSSGKQPPRRGSAPTVLQPTSPVPRHLNLDIPSIGSKRYLTPQPSPAKSVSFSFEGAEVGKVGVPTDLASVQEQGLTATEQQFYKTVVFWNGHIETDPSFSFLSSLCEASDESTNCCDFVQRAFVILAGTWAMTVFLGLLLPLPLAMMAIGVKYLDECPIQPKIPVYLLVGGSFGMMKLILRLCHQVRKMKDDIEIDMSDDDDIFTTTRLAHVALDIFLFICSKRRMLKRHVTVLRKLLVYLPVGV